MEQKIRVLVADNDKDFTAALESAFGRNPMLELVGIATDGRQALELAEQLQPDLMMLDLVLPEVDGLTIVQRLRESGIGMVVLSAFSSDNSNAVCAQMKVRYVMRSGFNRAGRQRPCLRQRIQSWRWKSRSQK